MKTDHHNCRLLIFFVTIVHLLIILPSLAPAEEKALEEKSAGKPFLSEVGLMGGYGWGTVKEGDYETALGILRLGTEAKNFFPTLATQKGTLSFILEPQFNPVRKPEHNSEFGVGLGVQYAYPLTERISPYVLAVVGPHYISVSTETQAQGFIFSTAVGVGTYLFVTKHAAFNIGYRLRHLSNAYTRRPNFGIENHIGTVGFSYFF